MLPKVKKTPKQQLKSFTAKARKEAARIEKEQEFRKKVEDLQWIEHDKLVLRKKQRQQLKQAKRNEQLARKAQNKNMLETESKEISEIRKKPVETDAQEEKDKVEEEIDYETEEYLKQKLLNNKIARDRPELFVNSNILQPIEPLVAEK